MRIFILIAENNITCRSGFGRSFPIFTLLDVLRVGVGLFSFDANHHVDIKVTDILGDTCIPCFAYIGTVWGVWVGRVRAILSLFPLVRSGKLFSDHGGVEIFWLAHGLCVVMSDPSTWTRHYLFTPSWPNHDFMVYNYKTEDACLCVFWVTPTHFTTISLFLRLLIELVTFDMMHKCFRI